MLLLHVLELHMVLEHSREPDAGLGCSHHDFSCVLTARALQACGIGEQSHGAAREYLIHMEIPHWSFKIPFPSFKSARGFLQLIHGHCQMNLRK